MHTAAYHFSESVRGVLTYQDLMRACGFADNDPAWKGSESGPIKGAVRESVRTAGYHLRLGSEFYLRVDDAAVSRGLATASLGNNEQTLLIPANGVAIVSTLETIAFDATLIGHLSLRQDLVMQGLIMPSQSQIDAGYVGGLFVLLYNLSAREVPLQLGDPILRLEVVRLHEPSKKTYEGEYRNITLARALKAPIHSGLLDMRAEVDKVSRDVSTTQLIGGLIGLLVLISTILTGALTYFGPLTERVRALEQRLEAFDKASQGREAQNEQPTRTEIEALRRELHSLEDRYQADRTTPKGDSDNQLGATPTPRSGRQP